jgi:hypothetical protein
MSKRYFLISRGFIDRYLGVINRFLEIRIVYGVDLNKINSGLEKLFELLGKREVVMGILPGIQWLKPNQEVEVVNIGHGHLGRGRAEEVQTFDAEVSAKSRNCFFPFYNLPYHAPIVHEGEVVVSGVGAGNYTVTVRSVTENAGFPSASTSSHSLMAALMFSRASSIVEPCE